MASLSMVKVWERDKKINKPNEITMAIDFINQDMEHQCEKLDLRFVPEAEQQAAVDEDREIDSSEADEIGYEGTAFDLGEAIAESLALAIDPYATGPGADAARKEAGLLGEEDTGLFAALKGLVKE